MTSVPDAPTRDRLRVGIVGLGWMGQVHARAYTRVRQHYPDLPLVPELVAVADNAGDSRLATAARAFGFADVHADWHELVARDDLDLVSVTGPNFIHRDVGVAAATAGKHLWIEKPAGRNAAETTEIANAVARAGVQSAAGFNYRNAPAVELARELIQTGRLGHIEQVDVTLLADYAAHPDGALTWRFLNAWAGSGVLGDLVSHGVDLVRHLVADVTELVADDAVFLHERPLVSGAVLRSSRIADGDRGQVENEDYVGALFRLVGGARGTLTASRVAVGEQCRYVVDVHGDRGALRWDFRRMGELQLCLDQDVENAGYHTHFVAPGDGQLTAFQPGAGVAMSFDDLKVIEAERLIRSIADGTPHGATVDDAWAAAEVVEAIHASALERRWIGLTNAIRS